MVDNEQRCVRDLRDSFAKGIELNVSEPLVSFKETILGVTKQELMDRREFIAKLNAQMLREQQLDRLKEDEGDDDDDAPRRPVVDEDDFGDSDDEQSDVLIDRIDTVYGARFDHTQIAAKVSVSGKMVTFSVEAVPLKSKLVSFLREHLDEVQDLQHFVSRSEDDGAVLLDEHRVAKHREFERKLADTLSSKMDIRDIAAFSPRSTGCNLLMVRDETLRSRCSLFGRLQRAASAEFAEV